MELLVEQTYRFPDKPPKNVAGLIDRASLLAFYRVHNAGLATEAKVVRRLRDKGIKKSDLSREAFLEHAWEWTLEHGGIILEQLK